MSQAVERHLHALTQSAPSMLRNVVMLMMAGALICVALIDLDPRTLDNGQNVWLKPLRFFLAFGIHLSTLLWIGSLTQRSAVDDRWFGLAAGLQAVVSLIEMTCIVVQAARGVHSHFNYATPFDHAVFTVMGAGTAVLLVAVVLMMAGLVRWRAGRVATVAAVAGLAIALLGGLIGVVMVIPTVEQRELLDAGARLTRIGSHHATAQASGFELPFFSWDLRRGDWRIPHFVGLHALQTMPLLAWLHLRARGPTHSVPYAIWLGVGAYVAVFASAVTLTASGRSVFDFGSYSWLWFGPPIAVYLVAALSLGHRSRFRASV